MSLGYRPSNRDPADNTIASFYHLRSQSKSGAGSGIIGVKDVYIPASPNYPPPNATVSASRYFVFLPMMVYMEDLGSYPFDVYNETQALTINRVAPDATLTTNTFKIFPETSIRRNIMEVHVGVGSGQPSDLLSYEGYFEASMIRYLDVDIFRRLQPFSFGYGGVMNLPVNSGIYS